MRRPALLRSRVAAAGRVAAAALGLLLAASAAPLSADGPGSPVVVKVFTVKFRRAEDAVALVRPLLSDDGSVLLQSRRNTLTVRDVAPAVERTAQALATFDVPPRPLSISVTLLKASPEPEAPGAGSSIPPEIRRAGDRLRRLFKFGSLRALDTVVVEGTEGDSVGYAVGADFRLEFLLDPSADAGVARLRSLALSRLRRDGAREVWRDLVRTSIVVPIGQPYVLGVGRDESATSALFLVFLASSRAAAPGPGIAGVR